MPRSTRSLAPALAALASLFLASASLLLPGCEGTSSGVDNPGITELTVSFRDEAGTAARVSGQLDVYGEDQNPALDPEPLATIRIQNSSLTKITSEDFRRITAIGAYPAGSPTAAKRAAATELDSTLPFNLVFRSDARTGSMTFGLAYDPDSRAFARSGEAVSRLDIRPKPLVRFEAKLAREAVHGDLGRVFIPGSPFQATLSDSDFVFEDLPEGTFPLRLLGNEGRVYAVSESLDTHLSRTYTPLREPLARVDSADSLAPAPFGLDAGPDREAFVRVGSLLDAKLAGVDSNDARISVLWRLIKGKAGDSVSILNPTRLQTEVKFTAEGAYAFEVAVTYRTRSLRDTVGVLVRKAPPPDMPRILQPNAGDTVKIGMAEPIVWESPDSGKVTLQISVGEGPWKTITSLFRDPGLSSFAWKPEASLLPDSLANSAQANIRILNHSDSLLINTSGAFLILR